MNKMENSIHNIRAFLKHKLIEDLDIIDNYSKERNSLHNIIKSTILNGESQSVLVMGPRGSGKSVVVNSVLEELNKTVNINAKCIKIELNGLIHTDDSLALKSCTTQMCLDEAADGKIFSTFAESLSFLLECLLTGNRATGKCLLFIIDEFDLFCYHDNQTLLYNLFDMTNYSQIPICVVGITCRLNVLELFEKRVISRFSHRVINIFPAPDLISERLQLCKKILSINKKHPKVNEWNTKIDKLVNKNAKFLNALTTLYETTKCYRVLKNILIQLISSLDEKNKQIKAEAFQDYVTSFCAGYKSQVINSLSVLEFCLIIAMYHHCEIYDHQPFNFEMILQRFLKFTEQNNKSLSTSRSVALKAFEHIKDVFLATIVINDNHEHDLVYVTKYSSLHPSKRVAIEFEELFDYGIAVKEAKYYHESKLELRYGRDSAEFVNVDTNPRIRTVQRWFHEWKLINSEPSSANDVIQMIKERSKIYQEEGLIVKYSENPFAILIITKLMQRAHYLPFSEDVFVDSSPLNDCFDHSLTVVLTPCQIGPIPLAVIITRGETVSDYQAGFQLLKDNVANLFGGERSRNFITNECETERSALKIVWPHSKSMLSEFHISQSIWRWLWRKQHISIQLRKGFYEDFQNILFAPTETTALEAFNKAIVNASNEKEWTWYITDYWKRKEDWCVAYRDIITYQTNNFSETTAKLFKDIVLGQNNFYSAILLVDFCCTLMEEFYLKRIRNCINQERPKLILSADDMKKSKYLKKEDIQQISNDVFHFIDEQTRDMHNVDISHGFCSCTQGRLGSYCIHQAAVLDHFVTIHLNTPISTEISRYLAFGEVVQPIELNTPTGEIVQQIKFESLLVQPIKLEITLVQSETDMPETEINSEIVQPIKFETPLESEIDLSETEINSEIEQPIKLESEIDIFEPELSIVLQENKFTPKLEPPDPHYTIINPCKDTANESIQKIIHLLKEKHKQFGTSRRSLRIFMARLEAIKTKEDWERFLRNVGSNNLRQFKRNVVSSQKTGFKRSRSARNVDSKKRRLNLENQ